jgi:hypothetical protein
MPQKAITPHQLLGLKATFLLENNWDRTKLLMNPKSEFETIITAEDLNHLRAICTTV